MPASRQIVMKANGVIESRWELRSRYFKGV